MAQNQALLKSYQRLPHCFVQWQGKVARHTVLRDIFLRTSNKNKGQIVAKYFLCFSESEVILFPELEYNWLVQVSHKKQMEKGTGGTLV